MESNKVKEGRNNMAKWLQTSIRNLSYKDAVDYRDKMMKMGIDHVSTIKHMNP